MTFLFAETSLAVAAGEADHLAIRRDFSSIVPPRRTVRRASQDVSIVLLKPCTDPSPYLDRFDWMEVIVVHALGWLARQT